MDLDCVHLAQDRIQWQTLRIILTERLLTGPDLRESDRGGRPGASAIQK
jgi:hypothetical protein